MKLSFIAIYLLLQVVFAQTDTTISGRTAIAQNNTHSSSDTINVTIVKYPSSNWFERNEGSLISGAIGVLVACISVYLSFYSQKRKEEKRMKELYKGYLFAIKAELVGHNKLLPLIKEEFGGIILKSIELNRIIIDKPSRIIPLTYLTELRLKFLESPIYNTVILAVFTAYLTKCELINNDIDLTRLINLSNASPSETNYGAALKTYFSTMSTQLDNVQTASLALIQYINEDLKRLGVNLEKSEVEYLIRN